MSILPDAGNPGGAVCTPKAQILKFVHSMTKGSGLWTKLMATTRPAKHTVCRCSYGSVIFDANSTGG